MERVGIRELRLQASAIVRRVAAGETFEVTDRGRVVARLVSAAPTGLAALAEQGLYRPPERHLHEIKPLKLRSGTRSPSSLIDEGRGE